MTITMRRQLLIMIFVLAGVLAGCQDMAGDLFDEKQEERPTQPKDSVWTVSIQAVRDDASTKGLNFIDGTATTDPLLQSIWKANETVEVYQGSTHIGTLTATPDASDAHKATLSGTVTTTNITPGTTKLTLLTPRQEWDYTGQVGKLLRVEDGTDLSSNRSIENRYHYTMAVDVPVTTIEGNTLTTGTASFKNQQSIYRMNFRFQNGGGGDKTAITARRIWITAAGGGLVQSQGIDGSSPVTGTIEVNLDNATENPFFVALRNSNTTDAENLTFKVLDYQGVTYYDTKNIPAEYKANGLFVSMKNATLTNRLSVTLHTGATVTTAL